MHGLYVYIGKREEKNKAAPVRLELTTFRHGNAPMNVSVVTVGRCNQLSHGARIFNGHLVGAGPARPCAWNFNHVLIMFYDITSSDSKVAMLVVIESSSRVIVSTHRLYTHTCTEFPTRDQMHRMYLRPHLPKCPDRRRSYR